MKYLGTIIEESLQSKEVLKDVKILGTKVEPVKEKHQTPWLKQWTLHKVEILEAEVGNIAEVISRNLDYSHGAWYADFENESTHYIIFKNKIFSVTKGNKADYLVAENYGKSLGIPNYQLDFVNRYA